MKHRNIDRSGAVRGLSRRVLRFAVPAAALVFGAQGAWAFCSINTAGEYKTKTIQMVVGRIVVPNELAVGQLITTPKEFPIYQAGANNTPWTCTGGGTVNGRILSSAVGAELTGMGKEKVFATSVAGIGIRLLRKALGTEGGETFYPHTYSTSDTFGEFWPEAKFVVELYKTAAVTGNGPLVNGIYTTYSGDDGVSVVTTTVSGDAITIVTPSCSVDAGSRNIPVNFGKVPVSEFKGRGTTAAERNFNIRLNCKAGVGEQNTVYLRMDATKDPAGDDGVLRITQGGTHVATGVGIQLVDGKSKAPVRFGDDAPVGRSKDGDYVLPYIARYFQTGNKVTPGQANGTATFTIDHK
ncbi:type 1 fimbria pilin [Variovorax boronicumulans]|uniref:fimbrial protein n=1 Tax=Variovorax boronicumulans TaxID=436515 RepID=UPI00278A76E1|nr:fimbrial protein [Variovorax boronicumulans]MDP9995571.1 type 1 fimbria pilin [Variovorax boronicumulans]MDQ0007186.1 type 1 fimbria pilin [Variovorax boronicumulans]